MKIHQGRQYIVTINLEYIRCLYKQQSEEKSQDEICRAVLKEIDDFLDGKTKRIVRCILPDGSPTFTITPFVKHNLQERHKAKRRKR